MEPLEQKENKEEPTELSEKLNLCEKEREEYLNGWRRAKADLINYKKEEMQRLEEVVKFGNEEILKECIVTLDNFGLAIAALEKAGPVEKGVYLIKAQIGNLLRKHGVERIAVASGQPFNPAQHEAIVTVESDNPSGTIVEEIETGYTLHGKVIRPSKVKVSK
ncbi:MAG: nucleotide exchange factor GrpE [Parcubacteria group bacterium]|nr:nucleotide exchange factor GrpE [Parcubacteria group bacterium]